MSNTEKSNILIIDDRPENINAIEKVLKRPDLNIIKATSANDALTQVHDLALIFLDVQSPDKDGVVAAKLMRENEKTKHVPIIFVTDINKEQKYVFKCDSGMVDYLFKPLDPDILQGKVNLFLSLKNKDRLLKELAIRDELTGFYNRSYITKVLEEEFSLAIKNKTDLSCLMIDLDFFKKTNYSYGYDFGDLVLRGVFDCLKQEARKQDYTFRYGGGEFLMLLPNTGINGAQGMAEKIRSACETKTHDDGTNSTIVTVSIGIASVKLNQPSEGKELIAFADNALCLAKSEGRNRIKTYKEKISEASIKDKTNDGKDIKCLKETLSFVLEKTKKASMEALELSVKDMGSSKFQEHNQNVKKYIELIGERLMLPPSIIETFKRAATLHDNFKILLEESLKSKNKGLKGEEKTEIEDYPYMMAELTELFDFFMNERSVLMYHHENYNGSGYPEGLRGHEIPLGARIYAIADAIVAMLSARPFRENLSPEKVVEELADGAGTQFDPMLVSLFFDVIERKKILAIPKNTLTKANEKVREAIRKKIKS